ncbi:hypothetical protein ABVT39_026808 [Epinephelus coioides]
MANSKEEADELEIFKPNLKSSGWKHFGFCKKGGVLDKSVAVCRMCKGQIKYSGNTTNLSNHLVRRHGIINDAAAEAAQGNFNVKVNVFAINRCVYLFISKII